MIFHIITLFPVVFQGVISSSILKRAQDKKLVKINFINPRDFATDKHKTVDDKPYSGGGGMVMKVDVIVKALESIPFFEKKQDHTLYSILLSASGKKYDQRKAQSFAKKKNIAIICGHYEGIDARVEKYVNEVISIGDFVLTGGEIAALAIIDSVTRLIPGVIHPESLKSESFSQVSSWSRFLSKNKFPVSSLLEYPQYTKPEEFRGSKVPKVLLSGNHKEVEAWREQEALKRTKRYRPDLLSDTKRKTTND